MNTFLQHLRPACFCLLLFCLPAPGYCQGEADWWYYHYSTGLHFVPGQNLPTSLDSTRQFSTNYGGYTSISDPCGNLLFVAGADSVFDKNLNLMPNGTINNNLDSLNIGDLDGDATVVPQPGFPDRYFVFYTHMHNSYPPIFTQSFRRKYALIDMNLNGGLGDVVVKNVELHPNAANTGSATLHANGEDFWTIYCDRDSVMFYCHLVTSAGVQPPLVFSFPGLQFPLPYPGANRPLTETTFSPDGRKLAFTSVDRQICLLLDFDPATGQLSNPIPLGNAIGTSGFLTGVNYGDVAFSPDGTKLYRSSRFFIYSNLPNYYYNLVQFDISSNNQAQIMQSGISIGQPFFFPPWFDDHSYFSLRNAPDGKIYFIDLLAIPTPPPITKTKFTALSPPIIPA